MNKKVLAVIITILVIAIVGGIFYIVYRNNNSNTQTGETIQEVLNSNRQAQEYNQAINETQNDEIIEDNATNEQETEDMKILVAFFSRAGENYAVGNIEVGNTEVMANYIADYTKGDLFKITPVNPYPEGYEETKTIATQEMNSNARPEIKSRVQNFDDYDVIFIGYPIWYGTYPMIINTFLESYNFDGKVIIPFNTHEGSGNSGTFNSIKSKMNKSTIMDGLAIRGASIKSSKSQVENWLKNLGF